MIFTDKDKPKYGKHNNYDRRRLRRTSHNGTHTLQPCKKCLLLFPLNQFYFYHFCEKSDKYKNFEFKNSQKNDEFSKWFKVKSKAQIHTTFPLHKKS